MKYLIAISLMAAASLAQADDYTVTQQGKAFSVTELNVKKGDQVTFQNNDPYVHNIFSLDEPMFFDLGTYPKGESRSVKFDSVGKFAVECAIHPEMRMVVTVAN